MVSIIALCYNHQPYLRQALASVLSQSYQALEMIVVDDASTDGSQAEIHSFLSQTPTHISVQCIFHTENRGNCRSFNEALALAKGDFVIDFALDDVMLPEKIANQVDYLSTRPQVGICFSNARIINLQNRHIRYHYPTDSFQKALIRPPEGLVFRNILQKHFICPPTLMMRMSVLRLLGGYDAMLAYEDFDLWLRASQITLFGYLDEASILYRRLPESLSQRFYQKKQNKLLASTLLVLQKAYNFCYEKEDFRALAHTTQYHLRQCFFMEDFVLLNHYVAFLKVPSLSKYTYFSTKLCVFFAKIRLKTFTLYELYKKIRYENN